MAFSNVQFDISWYSCGWKRWVKMSSCAESGGGRGTLRRTAIQHNVRKNCSQSSKVLYLLVVGRRGTNLRPLVRTDLLLSVSGSESGIQRTKTGVLWIWLDWWSAGFVQWLVVLVQEVSQLFVLSILTVIIDLLIMDVNNYFNALSNKWGQKRRELNLEVGKQLGQST